MYLARGSMRHSGQKESNGGGVHLHARDACHQLAMAGINPDSRTEQVKYCCAFSVNPLCRETKTFELLLTTVNTFFLDYDRPGDDSGQIP